MHQTYLYNNELRRYKILKQVLAYKRIKRFWLNKNFSVTSGQA